MSGNKQLLVDTNILIFVLQGNKYAAELLEGKILYISFITEIELLGVKGISTSEKNTILALLDSCIKIGYNDSIGKNAIALKQRKKVKTPDAILIATALQYNLPFVTADKELEGIESIDFILFEM